MMLAIVFLPIGSGTSFGAVAPSEDALKAAFIFNFAQFTRWPPETGASLPIRFCLYGTSLAPDGAASLSGKMVGGRPTEVGTFLSVELPDGCSVLFIGAEYGAERICELVGNAAADILTVSDMQGFAECGGHITLTTINNRLRFVVNLEAVDQSNLALSAQLLELAIISSAAR